LDYFGVIFLAITDKQIRLSLIKERIGPKIPHIMALLVNTNPAIRFRVIFIKISFSSLSVGFPFSLKSYRN